MGIYLVKNVINGVIFVKIGHFWGKWSKLAYFGGKNYVIVQNLGVGRKTVSKIMLVRLNIINLVHCVITGVYFVKLECRKF